MSEQGLLQAEQRVREMNRVTRQYAEQGNKFLQQMQNMQQTRNNQTRFEQVRPDNNNTYSKERNSIPRQQDRKNPQAMRTAQPVQQEPLIQNSACQNRPAERPQSVNLSLLSDMNLDGEKLMIILIMYLLIKEKADIKLILALGYLLL